MCGLLASAALALSACATPPPAVAVSHGMGLVRAEDEGSAARFGQLVGRLQPAVLEALPGSIERDTEVWIQRHLQHRRGQVVPENVKGFTLIGEDNDRGRIHLRRDTDHPEWFLAHELVHALVGPEWATLPGALEEGLCDAIAARLAPEAAPRIRALRAVEASLFLGRMRIVVEYDAPRLGSGRELEVDFHYQTGAEAIQLEELLTYDTLSLKERWKRLPDHVYGVGFLIVERIARFHGLEHLHELCVRAAEAGHTVVPVDWILEAAELTDVATRHHAPSELIGRAEFAAWRELVPGFHADLLVQLFGSRYGDLSASQLLTSVAPRLRLSDGSRVRLGDEPWLAAELDARWSRHTPSATR